VVLAAVTGTICRLRQQHLLAPAPAAAQVATKQALLLLRLRLVGLQGHTILLFHSSSSR
jgi:hypothetical protein